MSLSFKRTGKELFNATAAATGAWIPLDNGYNNAYQALYSVSLESGDWVTVQIRLEPNGPVFTQAITSTAGATLVPLDAPAKDIRVIKTGSAGNGRVYLYG